MQDAHLTQEDFTRLLQGEDAPRNQLVLHHLAVCPVCYAVAGYILDLYLAGDLTTDLSIVEIDLGRTRREAPRLWEELRSYPFEEQRALIRDAGRYQSWGLCELLCSESEKEAPRDHDRAWELAELAVAVGSTLPDLEPAEPAWRDLLRAYALAHLGNACRVAGDLEAAEQSFAAAEDFWRPAYQNVGDVLGYEARYLALLASLRRAQRLLPEALELLDRALAADPPSALAARILINRAKVFEESGDIDSAIHVLAEARAGAGVTVDGRLRLCLAQNRLDYLSKAGRFSEAQALVTGIEALSKEVGSEIDILRLRWTQARIAGGLGDVDQALRLFEEARDGFSRHSLPYDLALVSLELSLAYLGAAQPEKAVQSSEAALAILSLVSVERESLMAIRLLSEALAEKRLTTELIAQVVEQVQRSRQEHPASLGVHG